MMGVVKTWLLGIVLTAFAAGLARQMAPKGREQTMVRLVGGLLLTLVILRPLGRIDWDAVALPAGNFSGQEQVQQRYEEQLSEFSTIIAEKTAAYIWDKAQALGLTCRVSVLVETGENGIPLPEQVTIHGAYSAELAVWLDEKVGLPADKQIWLEEDEWTTSKKNES